MEYYAHTREDQKQTVSEHLHGVADMAAGFSIEMLRDAAYIAGLFHDLGKYALAFQDRLLRGSNEAYEHSACGAIEIGKLAQDPAARQMTYMLQYCIAGHHTGLPDGGTPADSPDGDNTLHSRLNRQKNYTGRCDYSGYTQQISLRLPDYRDVLAELMSCRDKTELIERYAFFTRYLFSCLTDADFLNTESFCDPERERERGLQGDFHALEQALTQKMNSFVCDTPLKQARGRLQQQALHNSQSSDPVSILNMPTGSGKTLCSLQIALQKCRMQKHKKKRIIYVIPYTSIIEQTADTFAPLCGEHTPILQHHSNFCFDSEGIPDKTFQKLKLSTENWDAPLIITTSVQFFQSLFHYKSSGLRKLHNIADSVIILDEVHLLPVDMLQPCLRGIGYLTRYLNCECVFLSATMPDYKPLFRQYLNGQQGVDLITQKDDFSFFQKCRYTNLGEQDPEHVAELAAKHRSSLIIVNSRRTARQMYRLLSGKKYHLSTYMTPHDRSETIRKIRSALEQDEPVSVVSTSLVEAGVDLDFEAVFRQLAGLDNILQSGGRCNREGKRPMGDVYIFRTQDKPQRDIRIRASIVQDLLDHGADLSTGACVEEYYRRLFDFNAQLIQENSIARNAVGFDSIPFRSYAQANQFIKEETVAVVIDKWERTAQLLEQLSNGNKRVRRELQQYSVALRVYGEFDQALKLGLIRDTGCGVYVLSNPDNYDPETGLDLGIQPIYMA